MGPLIMIMIAALLFVRKWSTSMFVFECILYLKTSISFYHFLRLIWWAIYIKMNHSHILVFFSKKRSIIGFEDIAGHKWYYHTGLQS